MDAVQEVRLCPSDIPGAELSKPYQVHTVSALRWWLLCRGIRFPTSWKKQKIIDRVNQAESEGTNIVDVDGSYLYRKYRSIVEAGETTVAQLEPPPPPLTGWKAVTSVTCEEIAPSIPVVTSGLLYSYLAGHVGRDGDEGAFRALDSGYNQWASGRLEEMEVNTNHPEYCHVRCKMKPSMKSGIYNVYLLLARDGKLATTICEATCECAAGRSASCTHVSALLHALDKLHPTPFQLNPNIRPLQEDSDTDETPCTSLPCQWKPPKKRKESSLEMSKAKIQKHDYAKPNKREVKMIEDFDPRPLEYRGTAASRLPQLLDTLKGEKLCISLLFDETYQRTVSETISQQPTSHHLPDSAELMKAIEAFKQSLVVTEERAREIERSTRAQRMSPLWFDMRRYRITASMFGAVLSRKRDTPPEKLVLRLIEPKAFSTEATRYGIDMEPVAVKEYVAYQQNNGHPELSVCASGFIINTAYSFLGASPDGVVYDPSNVLQPYGFLEIKCLYSVRFLSPLEASITSGFCSERVRNNELKLKTSHQYFAQVQGQMGIGERPWCDFVIYTTKGVNVQRIPFDHAFWTEKLLPKLISFYDNCVAPEIVSPVHCLGLPVRDLTKSSQ